MAVMKTYNISPKKLVKEQYYFIHDLTKENWVLVFTPEHYLFWHIALAEA